MAHKNMFTPRRLRQILSILIALLLIGAVSYLGVKHYNSSDAATGARMYLDPKDGSYAVGDKIDITIREDSGAEAVNGVQAYFTYDSTKLKYKTYVGSGVFDQEGSVKTDPGVFAIAQATSGQVTGDKPIATVTFEVTATSGSIPVTFTQSLCHVARYSDGKDILQTWTDATYTVKAPPPPSKATFFMEPSSGSYKTGQAISIALKVNSPDIPLYVVHPVVSYPKDQLEYTGFDNTGSAFPFGSTQDSPTVPPANPGTLIFTRNTKGGDPPFKGTGGLMVTIKFKVIGSSGSAALSYAQGSEALDGTGGPSVLDLAASTGANYAISSDQSPPPPPPPGQDPPPPPPGGDPGQPPTPPGSGDGGKGGGQIIPIDTSTGDAEVAPVLDSGASLSDVSKAEYYLGTKLVATVDKAPFTYTFNTKKMRNGTYDVTIKTYYKNGTVDTTHTTLKVNNPVNLSYLLSHYGLDILVLLIVLGALGYAAWKYLLPRMRGGGSGDGGYLFEDPDRTGIVSGDVTSPEPAVVAPSRLTIDKPATPEPAAGSSPTLITPALPPEAPAPKPAVPTPTPTPAAPESSETPEPTVIKPTKPASPDNSSTPPSPTVS